MAKISRHIAESILTGEKFSGRFEDACNGLVGALEGGVQVYSTSRSWDLGQDGKGLLPDGDAVVTCCSLESKVDSKSKLDIVRLFSGKRRTKVGRLYFCSSQLLSEHAQAAIEAGLHSDIPESTSLVILGRQQLGELAERDSEIFLHFYQQEYRDILSALKDLDRESSTAADSEALRLALSTIGNETSDTIRIELYEGSIRSVLSDGRARNLQECARDVSHVFRLSRMIPQDSLRHYIHLLENMGHLREEGGRYKLSEDGELAAKEQDETAKRELLEGRQFIRNELETALGDRLANDHYNRIWKIIQEKTTSFFFARGRQMVSFVSTLLGAVPTEATPETSAFVREIAAAVAATSTSSEQRIELEQAVSDMFEEPQSPANKWLVQLCVSFVAMCSLGLEEKTGRVVASLLARMSLVLDTDAALSLLGIGEANHESIKAVVSRWHALGGQVFVTEEILHEADYHARIADYDFEQVERWLPGSLQDRLRLIENVFVRAFGEHLARGQAHRTHWRSFIQQFRGRNASMAAILRGEGVAQLSCDSSNKGDLQAQVTKYLFAKLDQQHPDGASSAATLAKLKDKAKRDASLYASIVACIHRDRESDPDKGYFLVSSSRRLSGIEAKFSGADEPRFVITIGMAVYLISLVPEVSIGIGSLRAFLFDAPRAGFSGGLERLILRVIKESESYSLPWAKRPTLLRKLRENILERANSSIASERVDPRQLEEDMIKGNDIATATALLSQALDASPATHTLEQENAELRRQIASLQSQVNRRRQR